MGVGSEAFNEEEEDVCSSCAKFSIPMVVCQGRCRYDHKNEEQC